MQIVIDIPEEIHRDILEDGVLYLDYVTSLGEAIAHGIVLPKGHGRLIDADAVLEEPIGNTYEDIDIAETIIEADRGE